MILARLNRLHALINDGDLGWSITNANGRAIYRTRTVIDLRAALQAIGIDCEAIRELPDFDTWLRQGAPDMPLEPAADDQN